MTEEYMNYDTFICLMVVLVVVYGLLWWWESRLYWKLLTKYLPEMRLRQQELANTSVLRDPDKSLQVFEKFWAASIKQDEFRMSLRMSLIRAIPGGAIFDWLWHKLTRRAWP